MRTNSLNLKKKIAFIASLAMLAGTAAYLPADITAQLGFGASAEAAVANVVAADGSDAVDSEENKAGKIETLKSVYLTIDGKYVAVDDDGNYKTFSSLNSVSTGYTPVNVLNDGSINTPFVELDANEPVGEAVKATTKYDVADAATLVAEGGALYEGWKKYDTEAKKAALLVTDDEHTYNATAGTNYEANANAYTFKTQVQEYKKANVFKKTTTTAVDNEYNWRPGVDFGTKTNGTPENYGGKYYIKKEVSDGSGTTTTYYEVNGTEGRFDDAVLTDLSAADSTAGITDDILGDTGVNINVKETAGAADSTSYDVWYVTGTHPVSTEDYYVELTDTQASDTVYKKVTGPTDPSSGKIDPTTWVVDGKLKLTGVTYDSTDAAKGDLYTAGENPDLIDNVNTNTGVGTKVVRVPGIAEDITTDQPNENPTLKSIDDKSGFEVYTLNATTKYAVKTVPAQDGAGESAEPTTTYYRMTAAAAPDTYYTLEEVVENPDTEASEVDAVKNEILAAEQKAYVRKVNAENADANSKKQAAVDALTIAKDASGKYASIAIPYSIVTPSSVIELVPEVATGAALTSTSAQKIRLTLDANGKYTVPANTKKIIAQTDDSTWDATNSKFATDAEGNINAKGNYESLDFSGLAVELENDVEWKHVDKLSSTSISEGGITEQADSAEGVTPATYEFTKSGSVYAKNLIATTSTSIAPNATFTVELNPMNNWTVSGSNISNNKLTMTMGADGKAESGLITYTRSNGDKEYYLLTVKNAKGNVDNTKITATVGGVTATLEAMLGKENGIAKTTKEIISKTVGTGSAFVDVYTIALADNTTTEEKFILESTEGTIKPVSAYGNDTVPKSTDDTNTQITYTKPAGSTVDYTSPIVEYKKGDATGYLQLVITSNYDIDVYYDNDDTNTEADTTASVTNGTSVTKPETPTNPGYSFTGWKDENGTIVYNANSSVQQSLEITPFTELHADWTANDYFADYDANGGYWAESVTGSSVKERNSDNKATKISFAAKTGLENDIVDADQVEKPERLGYEFVGWSTDQNATEAMTAEELEDARPAELDGTVTLYAVWEAEENTVEFKVLAFNEGQSTAGTDEAHYTGATPATTGLTEAFIVDTDARYGELPTAKLKGYTFAGWYKQVKSGNSYTAVRVTSSSTLAAADRNNSGKDNKITLYAKFTQNKYSITMDLDGGVLSEKLTPSYAKFDNSNKVKLYNSENTELSLEKDASGITAFEKAVKKGSGAYYTLDYWTVSNGTESVKVQKGGLETYLTTNDASDLTVKAVWAVNNEFDDKGSIAFDTNEGAFYTLTNGEYTEANAYTGVDGPAKGAITQTVSRNTIKDGEDTYVLMRPGYTFTGWFADEELTTAFNFDVYPDGEEVTAYAGWKANTTTNYTMRYNLIDVDGSIIVPSETSDNNNKSNAGFEFYKTYKDTTGAEVNAADKTITYNGKTYVFSAKLSSGLNTKDEVYAAYKKGDKALNLVTYTDAIKNGFDQENAYTIIEGVFVDESVHTDTLGTVDDVAVDANGKVTWSAVENAVDYKVVKKIGDNTFYGEKTDGALEYQFGSVPKKEYKVRVVAFDKDGNKTWGKEVTITPAVDPKALGEITNVKVAADRKTVTWDAVDNAATYKVMKTINGKNWYTSEVADTTIEFKSATKGAFDVKVIAINADGSEKKWSEATHVDAIPSSLGTVGNCKVTEDGVVTWDEVEGAAYYRVFKISGNKKRFSEKIEDKTTYTLNNVPSTYRVYVVAYDGNGNYAVGPMTRVSDVAKATGVTVSADGTKVSWTGNDDAVQYQVAKLINGKTFYGKKVNADTTEYTFGSVAKAGTQVFVITFNADGDTSYSDAVTVQ